MTSTLGSKIRTANSALIDNDDLNAIGKFFSPDYIAHITCRDITGGHDTIRSILTTLRRAFPEVAVDIKILVESETRVAWQRTLSGIQQGDYKGFPATNRKIEWRDMVVSEFRDGLIAEDWVITDLAEQLLLARKQ